MKQSQARVLLLLVTVIWGSGYVVNDIILSSINAYQLLTSRFLITFIVLVLAFFPSLKRINKAALKKGAVLGVLLYAAFTLQTVGLIYTTPSKNAFLTAVSVVIVPILSFLMTKQRIETKTLFGIFITLIGVALMSLNGFGALNLGDVLSLLCALFFALQLVYQGKYVKETDPITLMIVQMGVAGSIGITVNLIRGDVYLGGDFSVDMSLLYLALFGTLFCYGMQAIAQQFASSTETSLILSLESFWGMAFSVLLLQEAVTSQMILGALFILAGIVSAEVKIDAHRIRSLLKIQSIQKKRAAELEDSII